MKIVKYDPKYKADFIRFNTDWIEDNFGTVESEDIATFNSIEAKIQFGGMVFFAVENDIVLACCMTYPMNGDLAFTFPVHETRCYPDGQTWEICKFASNKDVVHKGAGSAVFKETMDYAVRNGAKRIFMLSNKKLKPAIHIYEKYGFREIILPNYEYNRGDIAFELVI